MKNITEALDQACAELLSKGQGTRRYLGPSALKTCMRATWYAHRKTTPPEQFGGRMLRLFNRGHLEELRVYQWLRAADFEVREHAERLVWHPGSGCYAALPWDKEWGDDLDDCSGDQHHTELARRQGVELKQYSFATHGGHYKGHSDGRVRLPAPHRKGLFDGWGGIEVKTHKDSSFKQLTAKRVAKAKPEHYVQMTAYMREMKLPWTLYIGVNKDDDSIHTELVPYAPEVGDYYADCVEKVLRAHTPPTRVSADPTSWACKFCSHAGVCHHGQAPLTKCTTCAHARAIIDEGTDARWRCTLYEQLIPKDFEKVGCAQWVAPCD